VRGSGRDGPRGAPHLRAEGAPAQGDPHRPGRGTILTLINELDVILAGDASAITWIKAGLNYCVPFAVSNLGLLAGKRAEQEKPAHRDGG